MRLDIELFPFAPFADRVWALRSNLTSYDAWYVALAEAFGCPLVTLDQKLSPRPLVLPATSSPRPVADNRGSMIPRDCKRLAEVDFPIAEVSKHVALEKSIRHGHRSTLHLWWSWRPLASSHTC